MAEELTAASLEETEVGAQHPWPYLAELFEFLEEKRVLSLQVSPLH